MKKIVSVCFRDIRRRLGFGTARDVLRFGVLRSHAAHGNEAKRDKSFGKKTKVLAPLIGVYLYVKMKKEEREAHSH